MTAATLTKKGQITLPKSIRDRLGLEAGDKVQLELRQDRVIEVRPDTVDLFSLCGVVKPAVRGVTLEDMEDAIRKGASGE